MPPVINKPMTAFEWSLVVGLSILWGGSFFFVAVAVRELPPFTIVTLRVGLAALALVALLALLGRRMPRDLETWKAFAVMGFLNNLLPFSMIVWGQTQIASGLASILNATTPLFTVVVTHFLTSDERMTPARLLGILVGFAGVVAMIGPAALGGAGAHVLAQAAILVAALSYAFAGTYGRRFKRLGLDPLVTATGQVTAASLLLLPLALVVERPWSLPLPGLATWGAVLGLALASTALAYVLFFRILATAGATNLLLVTFLVPISAILLGTAILGERLEALHFLGIAAIAFGLAAIDGRLFRHLRGYALHK